MNAKTSPNAVASAPAAQTTAAEPLAEPTATAWPEWMARVLQEGVKPEQALAVIGLGLMNGLAEIPAARGWSWSPEEEGSQVDRHSLRQRLELVHLALQTGAPLSTAEVTHLLGARPGAAVVHRGGLTARRLARNVWKLSRSSEAPEASDTGNTHFREGFRRRL